MQTLRKSYSLSDLSEPDTSRSIMDMDMDVAQVERRPGGRSNRARPQSLRSSSTSTTVAKDSVDSYEDASGRRVLVKDSYR